MFTTCFSTFCWNSFPWQYVVNMSRKYNIWQIACPITFPFLYCIDVSLVYSVVLHELLIEFHSIVQFSHICSRLNIWQWLNRNEKAVRSCNINILSALHRLVDYFGKYTRPLSRPCEAILFFNLSIYNYTRNHASRSHSFNLLVIRHTITHIIYVLCNCVMPILYALRHINSVEIAVAHWYTQL